VLLRAHTSTHRHAQHHTAHTDPQVGVQRSSTVRVGSPLHSSQRGGRRRRVAVRALARLPPLPPPRWLRPHITFALPVYPFRRFGAAAGAFPAAAAPLVAPRAPPPPVTHGWRLARPSTSHIAAVPLQPAAQAAGASVVVRPPVCSHGCALVARHHAPRARAGARAAHARRRRSSAPHRESTCSSPAPSTPPPTTTPPDSLVRPRCANTLHTSHAAAAYICRGAPSAYSAHAHTPTRTETRQQHVPPLTTAHAHPRAHDNSHDTTADPTRYPAPLALALYYHVCLFVVAAP
jgi:hypothetical protein